MKAINHNTTLQIANTNTTHLDVLAEAFVDALLKVTRLACIGTQLLLCITYS